MIQEPRFPSESREVRGSPHSAIPILATRVRWAPVIPGTWPAFPEASKRPGPVESLRSTGLASLFHAFFLFPLKPWKPPCLPCLVGHVSCRDHQERPTSERED